MQDFDMVQEQNEKLKNGLMTAMAEITYFKNKKEQDDHNQSFMLRLEQNFEKEKEDNSQLLQDIRESLKI